jgi:hypothetical protein
MESPRISVVMVTCNVERFLAESIESILGQTFTNFEFIIVDFGSTDRTIPIITSYAAKDSRVRLHEIPTCGLAQARNTGCFFARGEYIAIMDADDISLPDRLQLEIVFMEEHSEVGLVGGVTECIDATGAPLAMRSHDFPAEDGEIRSALAVGCPFCQPTLLMRRQAFVLVGGYRPVFVQAEDYDLWLRISEHYRCANLKASVLKYRIHPYQVSMRRRSEQTLCVLAAQVAAAARKTGRPDPLSGVEEITPEVLVGLGVTKSEVQNALASDCRDWIRVMSDAGEFSAALKATVESLQSSDWQCAEKWRIADLWLTAAHLHWQQKEFSASFFALGHAVVTRPVVVGRPLRPVLRWLGLL